MIDIYTDGAFRKQGNLGGWGVYMITPVGTKTMYGYAKDTTSQRMELTAIIKALEIACKLDCPIKLYSDSQYAINGLNEWIEGWKTKNWTKYDRSPIKNLDLWKTLDHLKSLSESIEFIWVKGHAGNIGNEKADELANKGVEIIYGNKN